MRDFFPPGLLCPIFFPVDFAVHDFSGANCSTSPPPEKVMVLPNDIVLTYLCRREASYNMLPWMLLLPLLLLVLPRLLPLLPLQMLLAAVLLLKQELDI